MNGKMRIKTTCQLALKGSVNSLAMYFFIGALFLSPISVYAQTITGTVTSKETKDPVVGAMVKLFELESIQPSYYKTTNNEGKFTLTDVAPKTYRLTVQEITHKTYEQVIKVSNNENDFSIALQTDENIIGEAIVSANAETLIRKGDTTIIKQEFYLTGAERNLRDVLNNTPGLTVENNQVYFQGKPVTKFLLENKDILDYNKGLVLESIVPNDIDDLRIIEHYKDKINQLKEAQSEQTALNINLKKGALRLRSKLNARFNHKRYKTDISAYNAQPTIGFSAFAKANNLGEQTLTTADIMSLYSSIIEMTSAQKSGEEKTLKLINNEDANRGHTNVLGASIEKNFSPKIKVFTSLFANYHQLQSTKAVELSNFLTATTSQFQQDKSNKMPFITGKFNVEAEIDSTSIVELKTLYNFNTINNSINNQTQSNEANYINNSYKIATNYVKKFTKRNLILDHKTTFSNTKGNNNTTVIDTLAVFPQLINQNISHLRQDRKEKLTEITTTTSLKKKFPNHFNSTFSLAYNHFTTKANSQTGQSVLNFDNDFNETRSTLQPELTIEKGINGFVFTLEPKVKLFNHSTNSENNVKFNQRASVNYEFNMHRKIWLTAIQTDNYLSIEPQPNTYQIQDLNEITYSENYFSSLTNSKSLNLGFFSGNTTNPSFFLTNVGFTNSTNGLYNFLETFNDYSVSIQRVGQQQSSTNGNFVFRKSINLLGKKSNVQVRYMGSISNNEFEDSQFNFYQNNLNTGLSVYLTDRFMVNPVFNVAYTSQQNKSTLLNTNFLRLQPQLQTSISTNKIDTKTNFSYYSIVQQNNTFSSPLIIDFDLFIKLKKEFDIHIDAKDILNLKGSERESVRYYNTYSETARSQQRSGYILAGISKVF